MNEKNTKQKAKHYDMLRTESTSALTVNHIILSEHCTWFFIENKRDCHERHHVPPWD